jgi:hypothetical protein
MIPNEINFYHFRCLDARKTLLPEDHIQVCFFILFFLRKKSSLSSSIYCPRWVYVIFIIYIICIHTVIIYIYDFTYQIYI